MIKRLAVCFLLVSLFMSNLHAWNALGHRLIAQMAYNQLRPEVKRLVNQYNQSFDNSFAANSFVEAAVWLDTLYKPEYRWLKPMHYIDIPFSEDNTKFPPLNKINAVYAINHAIGVLQNKEASKHDKAFQLRILSHVLADIHQPMHAVSQFSRTFPQGDKGGNLLRLKTNLVASNLHAYWDNGGGLLKPRHKLSKNEVKRRARKMYYSCNPKWLVIDPYAWAEESHQLAVNKAYTIKPYEKPSGAYQAMVKKVSEQRIIQAACRLALVLNSLF